MSHTLIEHTTTHTASIGGEAVTFCAVCDEYPLPSSDGQCTGSVFSISYLVKDGTPERPVLFIFNGGPGSSSLWMHLGLFGPQTLAYRDEFDLPVAPPFLLEENGDCMLDLCDIVLIDPPGTGFGCSGASSGAYASYQKDAELFCDYIHHWLDKHGRWQAPKYLVGESYSIVENPKRHGKSYNKWLGDKKKPSHRERICTAIDDALTQKPDSFEALLELLRQAGYEVKGKKVPSLLGSEQKKSIRMDTLGDGYTPADLRAVIAGEKAHTPRKSAAAPVKPQKRSGNLLVDIQTKLRAGKGAGYARWATLFNLKQMAQTVAYLQDHELLDYAVLSEKAAAASAHFNELSARIKSAETRMAEIAVLREHIVGYTKTRDTYVAYRKAGYSKKFLAEHESEITIHKAAKNYFDGLGLKKLPTIKALNTEYAELLAEKKAAYADYRKAREEMKELLTAKANIDRILELDKEQEEANERREKEAEQR